MGSGSGSDGGSAGTTVTVGSIGVVGVMRSTTSYRFSDVGMAGCSLEDSIGSATTFFGRPRFFGAAGVFSTALGISSGVVNDSKALDESDGAG